MIPVLLWAEAGMSPVELEEAVHPEHAAMVTRMQFQAALAGDLREMGSSGATHCRDAMAACFPTWHIDLRDFQVCPCLVGPMHHLTARGLPQHQEGVRLALQH